MLKSLMILVGLIVFVAFLFGVYNFLSVIDGPPDDWEDEGTI